MSSIHKPDEHGNEEKKEFYEMNPSRPTTSRRVVFVDTRDEINAMSRTFEPGRVIILRGTDPEVIDYFVNFEWTDEDEARLQADLEGN